MHFGDCQWRRLRELKKPVIQDFGNTSILGETEPDWVCNDSSIQCNRVAAPYSRAEIHFNNTFSDGRLFLIHSNLRFPLPFFIFSVFLCRENTIQYYGTYFELAFLFSLRSHGNVAHWLTHALTFSKWKKNKTKYYLIYRVKYKFSLFTISAPCSGTKFMYRMIKTCKWLETYSLTLKLE